MEFGKLENPLLKFSQYKIGLQRDPMTIDFGDEIDFCSRLDLAFPFCKWFRNF